MLHFFSGGGRKEIGSGWDFTDGFSVDEVISNFIRQNRWEKNCLKKLNVYICVRKPGQKVSEVAASAQKAP